MEHKKGYWEVICTEGLHTLYQTKIATTLISETNLSKFLNFILSKYALTNDEVLEELITIPFKKKKKYFFITRKNEMKNGRVEIILEGQTSSISVIAQLVYE